MSDLPGLFAQAFGLARERIALFSAAVTILTALGTAIDLSPEGAAGAITTLYTLPSLYLQALLTAAALGLDPIRTASRRFPAIFGLSLLFGIGIVFGLVLLIIPGLLLLVRWSLSLPVLLGEESGVTESLRRSWELTAEHWMLALAVTSVLLLAWTPLLVLALLAPDQMAAPVVIALNLYNSLAIAFQWLLVAALYRRLCGQGHSSLPQIFS